jgi:hypothetical protein
VNKHLYLLLWTGFILFGCVRTVQAQTTPPPGPPTPAAPATGTPVPADTPEKPNILQRITQVLHFPVPSITEALQKVFTDAAEQETRNLSKEIGEWSQLFGEIIQTPPAKFYDDLAKNSLPAAGALAGALFLLRLALHHWSGLTGDNEPLTAVLSDWLVAGMLAVLSGPFLDLLVRLCWWLTGALLGETATLAQQFIQTITLADIIQGAGLLSKPSIFTTLLVFGLSLGGFLAVAGMLLAFGSASAVLFILAILGPPVAVIAVIPQMRWLRSLWIKAASLVAILPFVASGIFKASMTLGFLSLGGGLLSLILRILWLWGAAGFMLSLAGILSRLTIATSVDALGQMAGAVKGIAEKAALVGVTLGTGGVGAGIAGAGATGSSVGAVGTGSSSSVGGSGLGSSSLNAGASSNGLATGAEPGDGFSQALGHYREAQGWTAKARSLSALGLRGAAQFAQSLSQEHQIAGRQAELFERMQRLAEPEDEFAAFETGTPQTNLSPTHVASTSEQEPLVSGLRLSDSVSRRVMANFPGTRQEFGEAYQGFSQAVQEKEGSRFRMDAILAVHPEETARMVGAYKADPGTIQAADQPLRQAAIASWSNRVLFEAYGESLKNVSESDRGENS